MTDPERPVQINISGIPVAGVGGLGLVAMAVLVTIVMPAAWWLMVAGLSGGCVFAVALVLIRRIRRRDDANVDGGAILFKSVTTGEGLEPVRAVKPEVERDHLHRAFPAYVNDPAKRPALP